MSHEHGFDGHEAPAEYLGAAHEDSDHGEHGERLGATDVTTPAGQLSPGLAGFPAAPETNPGESILLTPVPAEVSPDPQGHPAGYVPPIVNDNRWAITPEGTDAAGQLIEQQGALPGADVIGQPEADAGHWTYMGGVSGFCGPDSISMVLSEFGLHESESDIATWAMSQPGGVTYEPQGASAGDLGFGLGSEQIAAALNHFGVPATATTGSYSDLVTALQSGRDVILGVDANAIWHNIDPSTEEGQGQTEGHAVVLTGIDPATQTAYLNDPGDPDGRMEAVPLNELMAAWNGEGNQIVVTEQAPEMHAGPIILPITLARAA
jgi:Peptidase_C39 like family